MPTITGTTGDVSGLVLGGQPLRAFVTPTIDLLAAGATYNFNTPLVPGKRLRVLNVFSVNILTKTGANVAASMVATLAQNGSTIQIANSNFTAANTNGVAAPQRVASSINSCANIDMTTSPLQLTIVTPWTGPTTMTGYFEVWCTYE